ncbi:MAG: hypothetical protein OXG99_02440 [Alphaproteobacteria bacterium]|nr:hypothetical protein [Alphaproteobacteria bacterium]
MQQFKSLYQFNEEGMKMFEEVFSGGRPDFSLDELSPQLSEPIDGTVGFRVREIATARDLAQSILGATGDRNVIELLPNTGLWSWLTFAWRSYLFEVESSGRRKLGEKHRWYPSDPNDWRKAQRHLVRMPVLLLHSFDKDADHLLCGRPSALPEIREQLTSQQDMFNRPFQRVARALYFDDRTGGLKKGVGGKGAGTPRRLAKVRQQFDVTWELEELEYQEVLAKLPREFDRFRPGL